MNNDCQINKFITTFKINNRSVCYNRGDSPHYQLEVDGFILDSLGGVLFAEVYWATHGDSSKDCEELEMLKEVYRPGTILRIISNTFEFKLGAIRFYYPVTEPLSKDEYKELAPFFPMEIRSGIVPEEAPAGSFYYAGSAFVEGKGLFLGNVSPKPSIGV